MARSAMRAYLLCFAAMPLLLAETWSAKANCQLPPNVSNRIGRAQIFVSKIPDKAALAGRRDIIWGDNGPATPGAYGMKYVSATRDLNPEHDLSWFDSHHPDWIARKCDRSVAFEFGNTKYVPVDTDNPAVRAHLFDDRIAPEFGQHRFPAIALDNVDARNIWSRCGVMEGANWKQHYGGARVDAQYAAHTADWVGWLSNRLHENGMCLAANVSFDMRETADYLRVTAKTDIVIDEAGFTRNCRPAQPGGAWYNRIKLFADLAKRQPLVIIDQVCRSREEITDKIVDWSLANYLLLKGDRTYLAITAQQGYGVLDDFPELYLKTGRPKTSFDKRGNVYYREFENALVLVNPDVTRTASYDSGSDRSWVDHRTGAALSGEVALAPGSAMIFKRSTQR